MDLKEIFHLNCVPLSLLLGLTVLIGLIGNALENALSVKSLVMISY
jgi:hypothetical protein